MAKNIFKIIAIFIIGAIGGIFADQLLWPYLVEKPLFEKYQLEDRPIHLTETIIIQENTAIIEAVEKVEKAVIGVKTDLKTGKTITGSGLAITSDGLVVTLAELVPQGASFNFYTNGEKASYRVLKRDLSANLALVKIEKTGLPTVSFADTEGIKKGQKVFLSGTIFENNILHRTANEGTIKRYNGDTIYTNISDDLLGSSLFDVEGNVLGLNTVNRSGEIEAISIQIVKEFAGF